jgi:gas vesicle protein GvpL/GvpF
MTVQSPPSTGAGKTTTAIYCYGVMQADAARAQQDAGIDGKSVEPVRAGALAALTSRAPSGKIRARRADLMCHFEVLRRALDDGTVLPLRFGTVFENEKSLVETFLKPRQDELVALLGDLSGRVELRVTAHYREEAILAEIVRENTRVGRLREATQQAPAHGDLIELGELVAAELRARTEHDARELLGRLGSVAIDYEVDDQPIEHQVLRGSFLVAHDRVPVFDAAMDRLASGQAGRIDFNYVGPLPPHSFVHLMPEGER